MFDVLDISVQRISPAFRDLIDFFTIKSRIFGI